MLQNGDKAIVFKPKVVEVVPNRSFGWLGSLWVKGLFDGHHYFMNQPLKGRAEQLGAKR